MLGVPEPERRIGRFLKAMVLGRRRVTLVVGVPKAAGASANLADNVTRYGELAVPLAKRAGYVAVSLRETICRVAYSAKSSRRADTD